MMLLQVHYLFPLLKGLVILALFDERCLKREKRG